jgi:hypothetical protein
MNSNVISRSKELGFGFLGLDKVCAICGQKANSGPLLVV